MSDLTLLSCEAWAGDSATAAALGAHLRLTAAAVAEVATRMAELADLGWESPAGRNFGEYVTAGAAGVRQASDLLQDAATRVTTVASALRNVEYSQYLAQQLP